MNKVRYFVLNSGLIVFGRVTQEDENIGAVVIESPMKLEMTVMQTPQGATPAQIPMPLVPFADDPITISKLQYISSGDAPKDLEELWLQTTTGIQLAN